MIDLPAIGGAVVLAAAIIALLLAFRIIGQSRQVLLTAQQAALDFRKATTDDEKELAARRHSTSLFGSFFMITGSILLSVALPLAPFWALDRLGVLSLQAVIHEASSVTFLAATTILGTVAWLGWRALARKRS